MSSKTLETYRWPSRLRRDLHVEWRGDELTALSRLELEVNAAPIADAANHHGFAACAVLAGLAELYPTNTENN